MGPICCPPPRIKYLPPPPPPSPPPISPPPSVDQYQYINLSNEPYTLVMLKKPKFVLQTMLDSYKFIWIDDNYQKSQSDIISVQSEIQINFSRFDNSLQVKEYIKSEPKQRKFTIVSCISLILEIQKQLAPLKSIQRIICFGGKPEKYDQLKYKKYIGQKFDFGAETKEALIQHFIQNRHKDRHEKTLPNFVALGDGWSSSIQLRTMIAMIKQKSDRKQMIQKFCKLVKEVYPSHKISKLEEFKKQSIQKQLSLQKSFLWYTTQSGVYKVLNNLLRSSLNPTQLFYLQPYFKDLFNSIKTVHQKEQSSSENKDFTCFRGAKLSQKEIEYFNQNIGRIILNLGFFSTSKQLKVAQIYAKNALFIINVKNKVFRSQFQFGYADVSQYSNFPDEKQILFNPLNTYKITQIKKDTKNNQKYIINLEYGKLAQIVQKYHHNEILSQNQSLCLAQALVLKQQIQHINCQGDVLLNNRGNYLTGCSQYWQYFINNTKNFKDNVQALQNIAKTRQENGNYIGAMALYQKSKNIRQAINGKKHPYYANSLNNLGRVLQQMKKYSQAINMYMDCLEIYIQQYGQNDIKIFRILNNIAMIYQISQKYQFALKLYRKCLTYLQKHNGKNHPDYATCLNNIGIVHKCLGNNQQALKIYEQCRNIRASIFGKSHPQYKMILNNIAFMYYDMKNYQQAIVLFEECKKINQFTTTGTSNIQYAQILHNIGCAHEKNKKYQQALKAWEQQRTVRRKVLGTNHQKYVYTLNKMGLTYQNIGKYSKALQLYYQCLDITKILYSMSHANYADTLQNIALTYQSMKKGQQAMKSWQECRRIRRSILGRKNPQYIYTLQNLSAIYYNLQKYRQSLQVQVQCLKIKKDIHGEINIQYARTLYNLGILQQIMGQNEFAMQTLQKCKKIRQHCLQNMNKRLDQEYIKILITLGLTQLILGKNISAVQTWTNCKNIQKNIKGKTNPLYAQILHNLAMANQKIKQYNQSLRLYNRCISIREEIFGKYHALCGCTLFQYGSLYYIIGDYQNALSLYQKCLDVRGRVLGKEHIDYGSTLNNMGLVFMAMGKYKQALSIFQECRVIILNSQGFYSSEYAQILQNLALTYQNIKLNSHSLKNWQQCKEIRQKILGIQDPLYQQTIQKIQALQYKIQKQQSKILTQQYGVIKNPQQNNDEKKTYTKGYISKINQNKNRNISKSNIAAIISQRNHKEFYQNMSKKSGMYDINIKSQCNQKRIKKKIADSNIKEREMEWDVGQKQSIKLNEMEVEQKTIDQSVFLKKFSHILFPVK